MAGTMMVKSMRSAAATKELRRELRQHQQRAAQAERHHHQADESGDVAQGHDDRAANTLLGVQRVFVMEHRMHDVQVREHRALGKAGGARGVHDDRDLVLGRVGAFLGGAWASRVEADGSPGAAPATTVAQRRDAEPPVAPCSAASETSTDAAQSFGCRPVPASARARSGGRPPRPAHGPAKLPTTNAMSLPSSSATQSPARRPAPAQSGGAAPAAPVRSTSAASRRTPPPRHPDSAAPPPATSR